MHVVMLLYPRFTQLDLTGPYEVFARVPEFTLHLAARTAEPVVDSGGLRILPTTTFADCPPADVIFVPGGPGQLDLMEDAQTLDFLRRQGAHAATITSVCTGSLVLAAAGLLTGYRATCHWLSLEQLRHFGVEPVAERVVWDRNRVSGGGVTSGIDFALTLVAGLFDEARARRIQLSMEYDPQPPYDSGSPRCADPALVREVAAATAAFQQRRDDVAARVGAAVRAAVQA